MSNKEEYINYNKCIRTQCKDCRFYNRCFEYKVKEKKHNVNNSNINYIKSNNFNSWAI